MDLRNNLQYSQKPGSITKVEALYFSYFNVPLDDDFLDLIVGSGTVGIGNGGLTGDVTTGRISTAQIENYVGEPASTIPTTPYPGIFPLSNQTEQVMFQIGPGLICQQCTFKSTRVR